MADTPIETKREKINKKREEFKHQIYSQIQLFINHPDCPKDTAVSYALEKTDFWLNEIINKRPQDKSFILSVALEIRQEFVSFAETLKNKE